MNSVRAVTRTRNVLSVGQGPAHRARRRSSDAGNWDEDRRARRSPFGRITTAACAAVFVAACGSGGDGDRDPVAAAEAQRISRAQNAATDAQTAVDEASAAFCDDSKEYIAAIDCYGKLKDESEATVGDVKTAGTDLDAPRSCRGERAQSAVDADAAFREATQELADAEAALAAAQSGTSTTRSDSATTTTIVPLVSATSVDRIKQAEADLATATKGVTDETTLKDATLQVNAAAYALEVAWLQLFAEAGCLTDEQLQQAVTAVTEYTTALQTALQTVGYYDGKIDGVYGPSTVDAVEELQRANGLPVTGLVDSATEAALSARRCSTSEEQARKKRSPTLRQCSQP